MVHSRQSTFQIAKYWCSKRFHVRRHIIIGTLAFYSSREKILCKPRIKLIDNENALKLPKSIFWKGFALESFQYSTVSSFNQRLQPPVLKNGALNF